MFLGIGLFLEIFKVVFEVEMEVFESEEMLFVFVYCLNLEGVVLIKLNVLLVILVIFLLIVIGFVDFLKKLNRFVFGCFLVLFFFLVDF